MIAASLFLCPFLNCWFILINLGYSYTDMWRSVNGKSEEQTNSRKEGRRDELDSEYRN